jgi:hypothetical protein
MQPAPDQHMGTEHAAEDGRSMERILTNSMEPSTTRETTSCEAIR